MDYSEQIWSRCEKIYQNLGDEESQLLYRSLFMWHMLGLEDFYRSVEKHDQERDYGWNELHTYDYFKNPDYKGVVLFDSGQNGLEFYYQLRTLGYRLLGFCDNNKRKVGTTYLGLPVFSVETLMEEYSDTFLIITPTNGREIIKRQVEALGFEPKNICLPITGFACIYNIDETQYFDREIIHLSDHEIFVDAGAYDGETAVNFARFCQECGKDYSKIVCFEPSAAISEKCRETFRRSQLHDTRIIEACVYREDCELRFDNANAESGSAAIAMDGGDSTVQAIAIDTCQDCKNATFIKMDIEGSELDGLIGAKETITRNKPKLAICLYHKTEDVIKIPMYIQSLRNDYTFHIRKYTPHHSEIVLYAV